MIAGVWQKSCTNEGNEMRPVDTPNQIEPRERGSAGTPPVPRQRRDEILTQAAAQSAPVVVTIRAQECWRTYKSRMLAAEVGRWLLIERPTPGSSSGPPEIAPGEELGITFRRGHRKCMFSAQVLQAAQAGTPSGPVAALAVGWPEWMQEFQRRVYQRVTPPPDGPIEVHLWPGGVEWRPSAAHGGVCVGRVTDLSVGGMAVTMAGTCALRMDDALGCAFAPRPEDEPFVFDATLRHVGRDAESNAVLGVQFVGLETSTYGRLAIARLARIVTAFHRAQARRNEARWRRARRPL
jgi:c-di-GMP-binding flagellar brake protein YcgR